MVNDINIIKHAISNLSSGEFQLFCEQYLSINGFSFISSKGGVPGTTITKPGTPDHICISQNRRFIFIEDTTQKGYGIKEKLFDDIDKCIINPMHKIPVNSIERLLFCYNQELKDESIIEECRIICESKGVEFDFLGLEEIANNLFNHPLKYSRLAESLLNLNISWPDFLSIEDFIGQSEKVNSSISMNNSFFGRKKEIDNAVNFIKDGNSVILYGNPGTGKTRLAIEACKALESEYSTICINGYSIISIEDLLEAIESVQSNQLILFIDDANAFSKLDAIKDVISHVSKAIILVITVRNYAKVKVEDKLNSFVTTKGILLHPFSREETKEFLHNSFGIRNPKYVSAIFRLSKGNSRLIVLASKLALEKQNLSSIADASGLYNVYYGSFLDNLDLNKDQMMTLGIIAYENRLYLKELDYLEPLFHTICFSSNSFIQECRYLEKAELLEINNDVVYFIDQSFKCFIQKRVFVDDRIIPLGLMVKKLFYIHPENSKSVINSILTIFQNRDVSSVVSSEIQSIVDDDEIQENSAFISFLSFFGPFFPMRVMKQLLKMMDGIDSWTQEECKMIIQSLESFVDSDQIEDAVELLFQILNERNELLDYISQVLTSSFSFTNYSKGFGYCTQQAVLKKMDSILQNANQVELDLIKSVIPEYLKTHFHYTERGDTRREMRVCQLDLQFDEQLAALRLIAWRILFSIKGFGSEVEDILMNYARESFISGFDKEIGVSDWIEIKKYINIFFNENNLKHCVIVNHLVEMIPSIPDSECITPFLSSKCFVLYKSLEAILDSERIRDYEHFVLPKSFVDTIKDYNINDYLFLFDTISDIKSIKALRQPTHIIPSLLYLIEDKGEIDLLELAGYCVRIGIIEEPFLISILLSVLARHYPDVILLNFIAAIDEQYRNNWMWSYYASKTESQVNDEVMEGFYVFLGTPDQKLSMIGFRSITRLKQYSTFDSSFIFNCLSIIEKNFKQAPFLYSSYLKDFFLKEPSQIVGYFNGDFSLLFNCYCKLICNNSGVEDYDGQFLAYVSCLNISFLEQYLVFASQNEDCIRNPYERLQSLWVSPSYTEFANRVYRFAKKIREHYKLRSLFDQFFGNLHIETNQKEEINNRIKAWVFHIINTNKDDKAELSYLAGLIEFIPMSIRSDCIVYFLGICDDVVIFKKIGLIPLYDSWSGSKIPMLNERIKYLETLEQRIKEPKYLMHRMIIDDYIKYYKKDIRESEIRELMDGWD